MFVELINTKKRNLINGAIHMHPNKDLNEFNAIYFNILLNKTSKESKLIFLLSDFNVDLLKYDHHASTDELLDSLCFHMLSPHIILPNIVASNSKALFVNIFSNTFGPDSVSVNLTAIVFDYLPQFVIVSNILLTHLQVIRQIFMKEIGLTLTKKMLFLTI